MGFLLVVGSILLVNTGWWIVLHRRLRGRPVLRVLLALAVGVPLLYLLSMMVVPDLARRSHTFVPMAPLAYVYLWHIIVLPLSAIAAGLVLGAQALLARRRERAGDGAAAGATGRLAGRRAFLGACAVGLPPLATGALTAWTLPRLDRLRVREDELRIAGLPPALDGLVVAHVSDLHVGKFTTDESVERFVASVDGMDADLVLFSGDLIDLSMADLPRAAAMLRRLQRSSRLFLCEGNHDLIDDGDAFRRGVREEGLTLLRDDKATLELRGVPVEIHGVRWTRGAGGRRQAAAGAGARRDPQAFPILLAHHPHVFDAAAEFPLVLSGHTHGGMLMWNEQLGAGPVLYRYWSGPYRVGERSIVVSNGAGNWFPLRTESPAEVGRIVLRA